MTQWKDWLYPRSSGGITDKIKYLKVIPQSPVSVSIIISRYHGRKRRKHTYKGTSGGVLLLTDSVPSWTHKDQKDRFITFNECVEVNYVQETSRGLIEILFHLNWCTCMYCTCSVCVCVIFSIIIHILYRKTLYYKFNKRGNIMSRLWILTLL